MLRRFRLEEPESVAEVSELLGRFGDNAKVYAGGTELLLTMKEGLVQYERLINVKQLGLNQVSADNGTLKWKMTFRKLTGAAGAAHIHIGRPGKAGPVAVALCGPCTSGKGGTVKVPRKYWAAVSSGGTYVNVHTEKNAAGEIRGQLKAS